MAKNNKTRFFYVLYCDKTWLFHLPERAQGPFYIIIPDEISNGNRTEWSPIRSVIIRVITCMITD